jgi:hypothetical protein
VMVVRTGPGDFMRYNNKYSHCQVKSVGSSPLT